MTLARTAAATTLAALAVATLVGCQGDPAPTTDPTPMHTAPEKTKAPEQAAVVEQPTAEPEVPVLNMPTAEGLTATQAGFEVTVTDLDYHVPGEDLYDEMYVEQPAENGQLIVIKVDVTNVGMGPATIDFSGWELYDVRPRFFMASDTHDVTSAPDEGEWAGSELADPLQPSTSRSGWVAFDVPTDVKAAAVVMQNDPYGSEQPAMIELLGREFQ